MVPFTSSVSNSLYYFVNERKTLNDAQSTCVSLGGHLVSYRSLEEQVGAGLAFRLLAACQAELCTCKLGLGLALARWLVV